MSNYCKRNHNDLYNTNNIQCPRAIILNYHAL